MGLAASLSRFVQNSRHIISISYKPTQLEFNKSAKIIILGIVLIGVLGLVFAIMISLIVTGTLSMI
ncbi:MAG: protein translocase SEC61 complex subunit gamma [Candidatus Marsarchaeota archaeon]|jgi:protein translocase SEC61 complex gamma subunit|nr:protein translocase SEC61 complex subunit gamma [Candidatus Marsarchaeota archaeon]